MLSVHLVLGIYVFACIGFCYPRKVFRLGSQSNWTESRDNCFLADRSDICGNSSGRCDVKIGNDDVNIQPSSLVWVNGYTWHSQWIAIKDCLKNTNIVLINVLANAKEIEFESSNSVTNCVKNCSNVEQYALYNNSCYCIPSSLEGSSVDLKSCNITCPGNPFEFCGGFGNKPFPNTYFTQYEHVKGPAFTKSPYESCGAFSPGKDYKENKFDVFDCDKMLPFLCRKNEHYNKTDVIVNDTLVTWKEAWESCHDNNSILLNILPNDLSILNVTTNQSYWIGIFAVREWIWGKDLVERNETECLVLLLKPDGKFAVETRNCETKNISGLCVSEVNDTSTNVWMTDSVATMSTIESSDSTKESGDKDKSATTGDKSDKSMDILLYVLIGIGVVGIIIIVIVIVVVLKRMRGTKQTPDPQVDNLNLYSVASNENRSTENPNAYCTASTSGLSSTVATTSGGDIYSNEIELTATGEHSDYNHVLLSEDKKLEPDNTNLYDHTGDFTDYHSLQFEKKKDIGCPDLYDHVPNDLHKGGVPSNDTYDSVSGVNYNN